MNDTRTKKAMRAAGLEPDIAIVRCAIYGRKSTSAGLEQAFNSLDAQREAGESYILGQAARGWQAIPTRYDDGGYTGANLDRPGFQRLLADIDAGKIDVVVVYKVDRLSRSLLDFARVMDRFAKAGAAFVSVTQNFSTADAIGRLTLNMLMSFAEFEREMIADRTRDKIAASRRKGKWTGGPVPFGYDVIDKCLVLNEHEAVIVVEICETYLEHRSLLAVLRVLNDRGRCITRRQAKNGNVRAARPWTKASILRVLKNPLYAGLVQAGDQLVRGEHVAILERAVFERVQAALEARPAPAAAVRNPAYLLRGILRCACCGKAMTPASSARAGRVYRYYRCITREQQGVDACPTKPFPAEALEVFVVDQIRGATADGRLAAEVAESLRARIHGERVALEKERRALPGAIGRVAAEGRQLAATGGDPSSPASRLVEDRLRELGDELGRLERRLAEVERQLAVLHNAEVEGAWVERALRDFATLWTELTPENRARLVQAVVEVVELDGPGERIVVRLANLGPPSPDAGRLRTDAGVGPPALLRTPVAATAALHAPLVSSPQETAP